MDDMTSNIQSEEISQEDKDLLLEEMYKENTVEVWEPLY